ncbi:MAG: ferrochelatase, partial [Gammaproteobacteria bacterium]|nr:ferrochelatase [Gammaproteobacteria bacterium]
MTQYHGPFPGNDNPETLGVLLVNLGTPDAPTTSAVRHYLAEFLSDPRVVEMPRLLWMLILHGVILRTRPARSAAAYRQVWTEQGSPLLKISKEQEQALQQLLEQQLEQPVKVELAMRYGNPSIASGLDKLRQANTRKIIVLPLYPQYSATTTASTFDAISKELQQWRWLPGLEFISHYHDHPAYIKALATSVRDYQQQHGTPEKLLMSFHGIPEDYHAAGDPYPDECRATSQLLADELGLDSEQWAISFQSRMGREEWVKPYTDKLIKEWGQK